ncbi:MAG: GNAT family N-acetyltransferase [Acidobacteriota bacterium]|nr:GNAT family N-acetyltransferase [Acidobacteriota bacterium]
MGSASPAVDITVRPLVERDLDETARIIRLAFATFLGLPPDDPRRPADSDYARSRWAADPSSVLAAEHAGKLIGSNFAANWGSFGFFGPLTVHPDYWDRKVGQHLLAPTMEIFRRWGNRHLGLYTFAHSPKHISLYQKFGFWPRDLVAIMAMEVPPAPAYSAAAASDSDTAYFSLVAPARRGELLVECRLLTNAVFEGLDLDREIRSVAQQNLGDTILLFDNSRLVAFAVCHTGPGSEAGSGVCYAKFAAVRPGPRSANHFDRLLDAIEHFARAKSAAKITAGVNLARREAYQQMFVRGFRTSMQGVAMETGAADSGYNRAGVYILDDWR